MLPTSSLTGTTYSPITVCPEHTTKTTYTAIHPPLTPLLGGTRSIHIAASSLCTYRFHHGLSFTLGHAAALTSPCTDTSTFAAQQQETGLLPPTLDTNLCTSPEAVLAAGSPNQSREQPLEGGLQRAVTAPIGCQEE
jgi:hypothetical protein